MRKKRFFFIIHSIVEIRKKSSGTQKHTGDCSTEIIQKNEKKKFLDGKRKENKI